MELLSYRSYNMRANWDQVEPLTLAPPEQDNQLKESMLSSHPEQQHHQAREQQAPQQQQQQQQQQPPPQTQPQHQHHHQEQKQAASTTPGWPNERAVVVKEEPAEEKNNDSGISPGHYISDSASPPSRQSPTMMGNGSISPTSTVSHDSNVVTSSNYTYTPPTPPQSMSPTMDFKATLDYAHAQLYGPKAVANQMVKVKNGLPLVDEEVSSKSVLGFELPEELEFAAESFRCPVCSYTSRKRVAFCVHIKSHCNVAVRMCEGNEFNKSMLKQLLNGSNIGNLDRMSPHLDDCDLDNTELGLRIPRVNPQGKVKTFRCKQCAFIGMTKVDFWDHSRAHIKLEKLLTCPRCPFVTEYKHHLEYHLRNHFGSKPYKCEQCDYSCVNKSMLNSHLKSHSNVYQFRCKDCSYATKYCHSLKLHLRKYDHSPAMVLNADGSPNPLPIIDVYGTRRGPKAKPKKECPTPPSILPMPQKTSPLGANLPQFQFNPVNGINDSTKMNGFQGFTGQAPMPPTPTLMGFSYNPVFAGFPSMTNPFAAAQAQAQAEAIQAVQAAGIDSIEKRIKLERLTAQYVEFTNSLLPEPNTAEEIEAAKEAAASRNIFNTDVPVNYAMACQSASRAQESLSPAIKQEKIDSAESSNPLDLSKPEGAAHELRAAVSATTPLASRVNSPKTSGTSRRKGRAVKLDRRFMTQDSDEEMPQEARHESPVERTEVRPPTSSPASSESNSAGSLGTSNEFTCQYCEISFGNEVMHSVHMGYHGYQNPYTCNMCGLPCSDKVTFFLHIARVKH